MNQHRFTTKLEHSASQPLNTRKLRGVSCVVSICRVFSCKCNHMAAAVASYTRKLEDLAAAVVSYTKKLDVSKVSVQSVEFSRITCHRVVLQGWAGRILEFSRVPGPGKYPPPRLSQNLPRRTISPLK